MSPPVGFPVKLTGALAWGPTSFNSNPESYVVKLGHGDIKDIDNALAKFNRMLITPSTTYVTNAHDPR